jgi:hypothetical protein
VCGAPACPREQGGIEVTFRDTRDGLPAQSCLVRNCGVSHETLNIGVKSFLTGEWRSSAQRRPGSVSRCRCSWLRLRGSHNLQGIPHVLEHLTVESVRDLLPELMDLIAAGGGAHSD